MLSIVLYRNIGHVLLFKIPSTGCLKSVSAFQGQSAAQSAWLLRASGGLVLFEVAQQLSAVILGSRVGG